MQADANLAKMRREFPLSASGDRVAALFASLAPLENSHLEERRKAGSLVAGEVGRNIPNAKTFHYLDDSHAMVIYSSLVDFYDIASKIMFGGANVYTDRGVFKAPDSIDGVVERLEALFRCWTPQGLADDLPSKVKLSPLDSEAAELANFQTSTCLLFLLSHELGHVFYYRPPSDDDIQSASSLTPEQESQSDVSGMQLLVQSADTPADARMRICGVITAMRVLAVFETLGHQFGGSHPPPLVRLNDLWEATRRFCKTERDFYSLTPLAYTADQQLAEAGIRAVGGSAKREATADRMFSILSAVIENVAKGRQSIDKVIEVMRFDFTNAERAQLEELAKIAARLFPPSPAHTESPSQDELWAEKAKVFRSLKDQWPESVRPLFNDAYNQLYALGETTHVDHRLP
jgi:hypothetical protein